MDSHQAAKSRKWVAWQPSNPNCDINFTLLSLFICFGGSSCTSMPVFDGDMYFFDHLILWSSALHTPRQRRQHTLSLPLSSRSPAPTTHRKLREIAKSVPDMLPFFTTAQSTAIDLQFCGRSGASSASLAYARQLTHLLMAFLKVGQLAFPQSLKPYLTPILALL